MKIPESYRDWAKAARKQGWKIARTRHNHLAWTPPGGRTVFTPGTPSSCAGGSLRVKAKLRRAGLEV